MSNVVARKFERKDTDFAYEIMAREDWNTNGDDVVRMFDFEPQGCFMADVDGKRTERPLPELPKQMFATTGSMKG